MPSTLFDSAGLAIVAYAQVNGATGSSSSTALANSGVTTTKVPATIGQYLVNLSTALGQDPSRNLIFVQAAIPATSPFYSTALANNIPASLAVDVDNYTKLVLLGTGTTAIDCGFDILVLRTILP